MSEGQDRQWVHISPRELLYLAALIAILSGLAAESTETPAIGVVGSVLTAGLLIGGDQATAVPYRWGGLVAGSIAALGLVSVVLVSTAGIGWASSLFIGLLAVIATVIHRYERLVVRAVVEL